jgi:hypothetical protein
MYVSVGAGPERDRVCAARTTSCAHGSFYVRQADAAPGTFGVSSACYPCLSGTTSYYGSGLTSTQHTNSECIRYELAPHPCGGGTTYYNVERQSGENSTCTPCTVCSEVTSECTATSDRVCGGGVEEGGGGGATHACNPGYYYNRYDDVNECVECTECVTTSISCSELRDAECGTNALVEFFESVYFLFLGMFVSWVSVYYVVQPTIVWRYGKEKYT